MRRMRILYRLVFLGILLMYMNILLQLKTHDVPVVLSTNQPIERLNSLTCTVAYKVVPARDAGADSRSVIRGLNIEREMIINMTIEAHQLRNNTTQFSTIIQNSSHGRTLSPTNGKRANKIFEDALVLGKRRETPGFLTIGIPTVQRETEHYLTETIESLIKKSSQEERSDVIILIFLADVEEGKRSKVREVIKDKFLPHLENGLIQVIQAAPSFYPPLENLKRNFGDKDDRVRWRSKQCVDFAFMFSYARNLSEYYLQIEDDVSAAAGYITAIRNYIQEKSNVQWATLEFSTMGFIGKLFHAYDLDRLAKFTLLFYDEQPVDWLFRYFKDLNAQTKNFVRKPSIFQHRGKQSSLKGKDTSKWTDKTFYDPDDSKNLYPNADNPSGNVYSNMTVYSDYEPQLCYGNSSGFFWAKKPVTGDILTVVFHKPTVIARLAVVTGSKEHPADILNEASLQLSSGVVQEASSGEVPICNDYVEVGRFLNGSIDVDVRTQFNATTTCLRIVVLKSQVQWAIIKEIAVWVLH